MAKRKIRPDRILIILLLIILIILLVVLGLKTIFKDSFDDDKQEEPVQEVVKDGIKINCLNYDVYKKDDKIGFGFVVAQLEFVSNKAIDYDLTNLSTDEGITLNDTFAYQKKLKTSGYDINSLNTSLDVISNDIKLSLKVFIPYINKSDKLVVSDTNNSITLNFDLNNNGIDMSTLKPEEEIQENIVTNSYEFKCDVPHIEDMMKHNGEPFDSSMLSVYCFKLTCLAIDEGVIINDACFIDSYGNETMAYDSSYTGKVDNILGKNIKVGDTYGLFFQLYSNQDDRVAYEGKIRLEFSDGTNVEVPTKMN